MNQFSRILATMWLLWLTMIHVASAAQGSAHIFGDAHIVTVPMENTGALPPGYASYAIPPFSVEFTTINTLTGDAATDAALLESEMAQPLKNIVGTFVQESFAAESAKLSQQSMHDSSIPEMLLDFVNVDFDILIHYRFQEDIDRRLRRKLTNGDASAFYLDFYAEFTGLAYFLVNDNRLLDEQVEEILGDWLNNNLVYMDEITKAFTKSTNPLLNNLQDLHFNTAIDSTGSSGGDSDTNNDEKTKQDDSPKLEKKEKRWSHAVKTAFTIVICLALAVALVLIARRIWPYLFPDHSIDPTIHNPGVIITGTLGNGFSSSALRSEDSAKSPKNRSRHGTMDSNDPLPGRGGDADEAQYMRQQSDRWLQKHRPDLFEAVQRAQNKHSPNKDGPFDEPDDGSSLPRSSPLSFLFGGMFRRTSPSKGHIAAEGTITQKEEIISENNDSIVFEDEETDANYDSTNNWWNNLMAALHTKKLACDEDPTQYEFPFQDFPRHDGTPCLIYSEDAEGSRILRGEHARRRFSTKESLSDEEFKRVLSLNSEDGGISIDASQEDMSITDGEEDVSYATPEFTDKLERLIAMRHRHYERQNILHKHKKAKEEQREIRLQEEARQKARMKQVQEEARQMKLEDEARERELKLRRHEMELDIDTIEAEFSPRASAARRANSGSKESITTAQAVISPVKREKEHVKRRKHKKSSASDPDLYKTIISSGESKDIFDLEPTYEHENSHSLERANLSASANNLSFTHDLSPSRFESSIPRPDLVSRGDSSNFRRKSGEPITPQKSAALVSPGLSPTSRSGGKNRSHRRCASYGTGTLDTPSPTADGVHRRDHSNDDVLTFGIAAYTGAFNTVE